MNWRSVGKAFAVVSALALGASYVAYRQVQARKTAEAEDSAALPGPESSGRSTVFPSSKNIDAVLGRLESSGRTNADFVGPDGGDPESWNEERPPEAIEESEEDDKHPGEGKSGLLSSSKVGLILTPEDARPIDRNNIDAVLDDSAREEDGRKQSDGRGK